MLFRSVNDLVCVAEVLRESAMFTPKQSRVVNYNRNCKIDHAKVILLSTSSATNCEHLMGRRDRRQTWPSLDSWKILDE